MPAGGLPAGVPSTTGWPSDSSQMGVPGTSPRVSITVTVTRAAADVGPKGQLALGVPTVRVQAEFLCLSLGACGGVAAASSPDGGPTL